MKLNIGRGLVKRGVELEEGVVLWFESLQVSLQSFRCRQKTFTQIFLVETKKICVKVGGFSV